MDWRQLTKLTNIGSIPDMGDNYYDGILDAHNNRYYITMEDEICMAQGDDERVYLAYDMTMDLINIFNRCGQDNDMAAREYVLNIEPAGYILERDLERV